MNVDISKALVPSGYKIYNGDSDNKTTQLQFAAVMNNVCREPLYFQVTDIKMFLDEDAKVGVSTQVVRELRLGAPILIFPWAPIEIGYPIIKAPYLPLYKFRNYLTFKYGLDKDKMFKQAYFEVEATLKRENNAHPHVLHPNFATVDYAFSNLN